MFLSPTHPPGRRDRKALAFSTEIHRLRAAGYTFEAIRLALLDAGVVVGRTTIKREAARPPAVVPCPPAAGISSPSGQALPRADGPVPASAPRRQAPAIPSPAGAAHPTGFSGDTRSGKDIADQFWETHCPNSLLSLLEGKDPP
ncbi:hypothetical protein [Pelomonas sp. KK5]|uniref:hypothetical protein n=1 Tax=Pelomonas sp. KK5 TaxID=1855730 RepID=UPI001181145C|nr:hypothetical protein [Pelomonas sp. KK5]